MPTLYTLNQEGFLFTETTGEWAILTADFGEGYQAGASIGSPDGLRTWTIKIDALPDSTDQGAPGVAKDFATEFLLLEEGDGHLLWEDGGLVLLDNLVGRAQYLWAFFRTVKGAGNQAFWIEFDDPDDGLRKQFLASFTDHKLSYAVMCAKVYGTGLALVQRRVAGVTSPVVVT